MVEQRALGSNVWAQVRLMDFGGSRVLGGAEKPMGGALGWKAPEVILTKKCPPCAAADIFFLGRVVVFAVTGEKPVRAATRR
eukprot:3972315-Pyramimonas_sp.AAC.1